MKVLVMGGTRFNGLALVRELTRRGHDVTVLNRGRTQARIPRSVRRLQCDRHDLDRLRELLADQSFDCVQDINAYTIDDVRSMVDIFSGRIGHYIFASSTVIYARASVLPITEDHPVDRSQRQGAYGLNKLVCEDYLLEEFRGRGFPASIVAFSMVFGPNNFIADREARMFQRLLMGRPILIPGDGTTLGQVGYVDDEAHALEMMMLKPNTFGKRYNLTGRDYWSDEGYVDTFADVLGVEPQKLLVPSQTMDALSLSSEGGLQQPLIQRLAYYIHRWNDSVVFSIDRLRRDVGFEPSYGFRAMVEATYEWYLAEGLDKTQQFDFSKEDELIASLT